MQAAEVRWVKGQGQWSRCGPRQVESLEDSASMEVSEKVSKGSSITPRDRSLGDGVNDDEDEPWKLKKQLSELKGQLVNEQKSSERLSKQLALARMMLFAQVWVMTRQIDVS